MFPQAASNRLHRLDLAPHSARAPLVQEFPRPCRADVFPKLLEVLPQQVAADALQVVLEQLGQFHRLLVSQVLPSLQQTPPRVWRQLFFRYGDN